MIRQNVDFAINELRFKHLIIFHLNSFLLLMLKINKNQFYFIREYYIRGPNPLNKVKNVKDDPKTIIKLKGQVGTLLCK